MPLNKSECCEKCEDRQQIGCPDGMVGCCVYHCQIVCKNLSCPCHQVPTEKSVNFMQAGNYHCFGCHGTFPPNNQHIFLCKEEPTKCTEKCGGWFKSPKQSWSERFDKWSAGLPMDNRSYEAILGAKDIPFLKSFITSLLKEVREEEREALKKRIRSEFGLWVGEILTQQGLDEIIRSINK